MRGEIMQRLRLPKTRTLLYAQQPRRRIPGNKASGVRGSRKPAQPRSLAIAIVISGAALGLVTPLALPPHRKTI